MQRLFTASVTTIAALLVAVPEITSHDWTRSPVQEAGASHSPPVAGLPLRQQMVLIQAALSRVAADALEPDRLPETLVAIEQVQRRLIEAKLADPPHLDKISDDQREKHELAHRAMLSRALGEVCRLEVAVIDGDSDRVRESLQRLNTLRQQGHERFQPQDGRPQEADIQLDDAVVLQAKQRQMYVGEYEFAEIGFRVSIVERDEALYLETFGQPAERLYALGDHRFQIAVAVGTEFRFDVDDQGVPLAIVIDPGGGRPQQRIERVR